MVENSYRKWSVNSSLINGGYKADNNSIYKNYELKEKPKAVKRNGSNSYSKFSYGYRKEEIDKQLEREKIIAEEGGLVNLHVDLAISWAKDIHPNGPEPSSVVTWIDYNGKDETLTFGLVQGGSREYHGISAETAFEFTESDSKGRFVYQNNL